MGALLLGSESKAITERDLLTFGRAIAAQIAQAAALAESFTRLREGEEAGRVLSASLDLEQTLASLGRLATARLADVCEVRLGEAEPRVYTAERLSGSSPAQRTALMSPLPNCQMVMRLVAHRQVLGSVTLARTRPGRQFSVADRKSAEDLIERGAIAIMNASLYKTAKDASRMKDEFLATLSHELRNPLASVRTAVELISRRVSADAGVTTSVKIIEEQLDFVRRMLDDLLDVTRISTGKVRLKMMPVTLDEVIDKTVDAARPWIEERSQNIKVIGPGSSIVVQGDPDRLNQVFLNLLSNATKYTPEGGNIWVKITIEGDEAVVRISDTGVGIPSEMLPRIFDLFTQVETRLSHGGLGIGLALVKDFVALHGGSVQVRSEGVGKGSEFMVRLPLEIQRKNSEL